MDVLAASTYLDTDLAINVATNETLGFVVTRHQLVLGVPNWFMSRRPLCSTPVDVTASPD
ncbi:MAG: hypothetical protein KJZ80_04870 [Hyphomicrobiaceae bacterium]|nr:hypothetical protein [Hyphomicrobiaceae bacterium]